MLIADHDLVSDFRDKYPSAIFGNRIAYSRIRTLHPDPIGCLIILLPVESYFHASLPLLIIVLPYRSQFRQRQRKPHIGDRDMYRTVRNTDEGVRIVSVTAYLVHDFDNAELS